MQKEGGTRESIEKTRKYDKNMKEVSKLSLIFLSFLIGTLLDFPSYSFFFISWQYLYVYEKDIGQDKGKTSGKKPLDLPPTTTQTPSRFIECKSWFRKKNKFQTKTKKPYQDNKYSNIFYLET